jgi:hypothetical protein
MEDSEIQHPKGGRRGVVNDVVFAVIAIIGLTVFLVVIMRRDRGQKEVTKDWWKWPNA